MAQRAVADAGGAVDWLAEHEAKELLRGAGVGVVDGPVVVDEDDAVAALAELGGHDRAEAERARRSSTSPSSARSRSACAREAEVRAAFARLSALAAGPTASVLAERMAAPGVELIVAARADAVVPALVIGLGGVWTEVLDDVAIVPLPGRRRPDRAGARGRCAAPRC